MKSKIIFLFCLIFLISSSVFSQNSAVQTGPPAKNSKTYQKSDEPVLSNRPIINEQRDEYGSFNVNGFLGGLNGSLNYVSVPSNAAFAQNADGTIEMWIYPLSVTGTQELMSKGATSNNDFMLGLVGNILYFRIGTTPVQNTAGATISANVWTHIAVTWTGGGPYTVRFYVNGAQSGSTYNNTGTWNITTDPIRIGGPCPAFSSEVYNGYIDEVKFWEPLRSQTQIATNRFVGLGDGANANATNALTSSSHYSGLISSWTMNTNGQAFDDISGFNGTYMGTAAAFSTLAGQPIPYNFALLCPGSGNTSYVTIPNNAAFILAAGGTAECWVKINSTAGTQELISKSATSNTQYMFGLVGGLMYMRFGSTPTQNTGGVTLTADKWYHLAWTWSGTPGNYSIKFYVNGTQSGPTATNNGIMNATTDPLTIGNGQGFPTENFNGYVDEVRLWNVAKDIDRIRYGMFCSARGMTAVHLVGLVGAWNFDSNLLNFSAVGAGINGSFNTGGANNCRLSAYSNESSTGSIGTGFTAHATVVNRSAASNPFPGGYAIKAPNVVIPDLGTVTDNIVMGGTGPVTSVEVFLSIQHTYVNDLRITLTAPNSQVRNLIVQHGGGNSSGILTFIVDGGTLTSAANFLAPWSNVAGPDAAMGTFGGSNVNGTWTLTVQDMVAGDSGWLLGWGIRLNGALIGIPPISNNIPNRFNLYQNFPNPFNPTTNIKFDLAKDANVKIKIYDVIGREVAAPLDEFKKAGQYQITFDGSNLASGTYLYKIEAGDFVETKKMTLVK